MAEHDEQVARSERVARNESLYRQVNEQIAELSEHQRQANLPVLCECGHLSCSRTIEVSAAEYAAVRADPTHFILLPGHEMPEFERVVAEGTGYVVVEKIGDARSIVRGLDPRAE